ncbi:unnamed protein product [Protopolystoma xenopodis]|uniref:TRC8-like N-terminal domain-containing protein n=1 Tax=Protopolystoma xenopodis TaxID=117903 RepID=A0A448WRE2_9PLAT|nr:unnamed protein product [Protopolystoma xenopodis]
MQEIPQIVRDVLRLLYYKNLTQMCCLAAACIGAFCSDYWLRQAVYTNGGLYLLISHLFAYDFTLEDGGINLSENTNIQVCSLFSLAIIEIICLPLQSSPIGI